VAVYYAKFRQVTLIATDMIRAFRSGLSEDGRGSRNRASFQVVFACTTEQETCDCDPRQRYRTSGWHASLHESIIACSPISDQQTPSHRGILHHKLSSKSETEGLQRYTSESWCLVFCRCYDCEDDHIRVLLDRPFSFATFDPALLNEDGSVQNPGGAEVSIFTSQKQQSRLSKP
jgi:hypothetical protein